MIRRPFNPIFPRFFPFLRVWSLVDDIYDWGGEGKGEDCRKNGCMGLLEGIEKHTPGIHCMNNEVGSTSRFVILEVDAGWGFYSAGDFVFCIWW